MDGSNPQNVSWGLVEEFCFLSALQAVSNFSGSQQEKADLSPLGKCYLLCIVTEQGV